MSWAVNSGAQQTAAIASTTTSLAAALPGAVAVGDVIEVGCSYGTSIDNPTSAVFTDQLGNTYTKKSGALDATNFQAVETHQCIVTVAGTPTLTMKANPTPGTTRMDNAIWNADPLTGSDAASASDGGAAQKQASPTTTADLLKSPDFATAVDGDAIYTATADTATGGNPGSVGTGFTLLQSGGVGIVNVKTAYKVQGAHSATTAGLWTAAVNDAHVTAAHATTPASGFPPELLCSPRPQALPYP